MPRIDARGCGVHTLGAEDAQRHCVRRMGNAERTLNLGEVPNQQVSGAVNPHEMERLGAHELKAHGALPIGVERPA